MWCICFVKAWASAPLKDSPACIGTQCFRFWKRLGMYAAKRAGRNRVLAFSDGLVTKETWLSKRGR